VRRLALVFAFAAACGGSQKPAEPVPPPEPEPPALPGPMTAKGFALGHFANTTHVMVGADLAGLRASSLYERLSPMLLAQAEAQLDKFRQQCNIDFVTAVDSLLLGASLQENETTVVALQSSLERAPLLECMTAVYGEKVAVAEEQDVVGVTAEDVTLYMAWPVPGMTVMALPTGPDITGAYLGDRLAGKTPVTEGPTLPGLVDETNTAATLWMVLAPPAENNPLAAMQGEPPQALLGSLQLDAGFNLEMRARYGNADAPAQQSQQLAAILSQVGSADPVMGKVAQGTKVNVDGNDLVVTVALDESTFAEVLERVLQQLGPMMGGGAAGPGFGSGGN